MLAKPAAMPRRPSSYAYEPKWDGFRCMLRTEHSLRIISRRRWNMTPLLPELEAFPVKGVFDGELIAFSEGQPDFVALCDRMLLHSDVRIPIAFVAFDLLSLDGTDTMREPYWKRREILETLDLVGSHWITTPSFDDGEALWTVVADEDLYGLVAKPLGSTYKPNERGWLKVKNKAYWKYEVEREAVFECRSSDGTRRVRERHGRSTRFNERQLHSAA
jgi:bifunctional non-homologous end joining protein LigD